MYCKYVNQIELPLIICNQNKGSNRRKNSISVQLVAFGKGVTDPNLGEHVQEYARKP